MDPARFLDLALILKGGQGTSENYRTAISRAYYAAFHVGVKALKVVGIRHSDGPGGQLQADYDPDDPGVESRTEADIADIESSQIIDQINKLVSDNSKAMARTEMRRAARDIFKLQVS